MAILAVENERTSFESMKDIKHLNYSINEHMKRIKGYLEGVKIMKLFQVMGEHSVKFKGMSFMSNRTMANKLGVSVRTIQRYTKKLEQLNVILKIPTLRKNNHSQTSNTYVILPVLKRVVMGGVIPINPSLNSLKHEKENIYSESIKINKNLLNKAKKFLELKFTDLEKQGRNIKFLTSYLDKMLVSWERNARYEEAKREKILQKQCDEKIMKPFKEEVRATAIFNDDGSIFDPFK